MHKVPAGLRPGSSGAIDARSPSPGVGHTRAANSVQYPVPTTAPDSSSSHGHGPYVQSWNPSSVGMNYSSNGVQSPGSGLQKKPSYRPPGASAPRIPGYASAVLDSRDDSPPASLSSDLYSPKSNASSSYFPLDANYASNLSTLSNIPPPPPLNPPAHTQTAARPNNLFERNSSEDILVPGNHGFARPLSCRKFFSSFFFFFRYLLDRPDRRSPLLSVSSSEHPQQSTSTVSTSSSTYLNGLQRNLTASTVATTSTLPSTYSGGSKDKDTIAERTSTTIERGDSYSSHSHLRGETPAPAPLSERQQSEPARSETTARSRLASEIERLKNREAMEDATNSYADDEYYDEDEEYYSEEESLDSFVNFSLLSNIAVWLRDQVPRGTHVKGSIPYPRAFTGRDIVVCAIPRFSRTTPDLASPVPVPSSLRSSRASTRSSSSTKVLRLIIAPSRCKLRAVCNSNFSSMRSNGADACFKTVSRTCTCFSTTRRVLPMLHAIRRSSQRA